MLCYVCSDNGSLWHMGSLCRGKLWLTICCLLLRRLLLSSSKLNQMCFWQQM